MFPNQYKSQVAQLVVLVGVVGAKRMGLGNRLVGYAIMYHDGVDQNVGNVVGLGCVESGPNSG